MTEFKSEAAKHAHEMNLRVERLQVLYELDKRDDPSHEHHHTFTGLFQKYRSDDKL
jgi:hypothetical protein